MSNRILNEIKPKEVFKYFEDLTRIPRCSGKEEKVVEYLIDFANKHGFEWKKDNKLNVLIKKPATKGYESRSTVILQSHTDMVCEKNKDTKHDFDTDPIAIEIEDDKIIAKETTLGADDGIGVAIAMAFLADKDAEHPALEAVFTSDEERGLAGAEYFDINMLDGRILINLDANDDKQFVVGSAGGPVLKIDIPIDRVTLGSKDKIAFKIKIQGLTGGHSGEDIHRGRANANKLMARLLQSVSGNLELFLSDINGGIQYNAIPREAEAIIFIKNKEIQNLKDAIHSYQTIYQNEFRTTDPNLEIKLLKYLEAPEEVLTEESAEKIINFLYLSDNGVIRMDSEIPDTVESSINLGVVYLDNRKAVIQVMTRSSVESVYKEMHNKIIFLSEVIGGKVHIMSDCPEWEYNPSSRLKETFYDVYLNMFHQEPELLVLHAGLECGVFAQKTTDYIDMIAVGPKSRNLHAPGEYLSISSVDRFWRFFKEAIKAIG